MPHQDVFLIGLVIPAIRSRAYSCAARDRERRPIDWRILGGGIVFGAVVLLWASAAYRSRRKWSLSSR